MHHRHHYSEAFNQLSRKPSKLLSKYSSNLQGKLNLSEIHDILKKSIINSPEISKRCRKPSAEISKYLNKHKNEPSIKQVSSPNIYRPFKVRCQSPVLKLRYSRPKLSASHNNFIVTQLKTPEKNNKERNK